MNPQSDKVWCRKCGCEELLAGVLDHEKGTGHPFEPQAEPKTKLPCTTRGKLKEHEPDCPAEFPAEPVEEALDPEDLCHLCGGRRKFHPYIADVNGSFNCEAFAPSRPQSKEPVCPKCGGSIDAVDICEQCGFMMPTQAVEGPYHPLATFQNAYQKWTIEGPDGQHHGAWKTKEGAKSKAKILNVGYAAGLAFREAQMGKLVAVLISAQSWAKFDEKRTEGGRKGLLNAINAALAEYQEGKGKP